MFHVRAPRWRRRIHFTNISRPKSNCLIIHFYQFVRLLGFFNLRPRIIRKSEKKAVKLVYYPLTYGKRKTNKRAQALISILIA